MSVIDVWFLWRSLLILTLETSLKLQQRGKRELDETKSLMSITSALSVLKHRKFSACPMPEINQVCVVREFLKTRQHL